MATFTVSNLNDAGAGSLRAAIQAANADSSETPAVIQFSVGGTITLTSDLPEISRNVTIDATSAPGHVDGGAPVVEIDCNQQGGLVFAAGSDGSRLLGLAVDNASGNGVTLNAGSITLNDNYIGLNLAGAAYGNGGDGVYVSATSSNNLIGLNPLGASGVVANVISGNAGNGLSFHGSSGNTVVSNRIGTDATGTTAIANGGNGIWVTAASDGNVIGGTEFVDTATGQVNNPTGDKGTATPVFVVPPLGNLVSGNGQNGILIDTNSQNNVLNGNFVGTTADGNAAIGNAADGVWINGADNNSLIGCQFVNNPFVYYNVVSGNGANGLQITNSDNVTVQANFFGVGANNTSIVANQGDGILVDGSSANTQVGGVIPLGNVAAGNGLNGIEVRDTVSGFITFNTFGGLLAFKGAAPNGNDGLLITSTGGNNTVRTNVFSGNLNNGIEIAGDASGVTVDPNIAGLDTVGNAPLPNGNNGLLIDGTAHDNVIGGYTNSVIPQNTFSGNGGYGVAITGQAHDNKVFNSYIGTDALGLAAMGNQLGGVLVGGGANNIVIGGTSTDPSTPTANLISGNTGNGVTLAAGASDIQVVDNSIGLDRFGAPLLPNSGDAIYVADGVPATLTGSAGGVVVAGNGPLTYTGVAGDQTVTGGGTSSVALPTGSTALVGMTGVATVTSAGHHSTILGGSGSLNIVENGSNDTIVGGAGTAGVGTATINAAGATDLTVFDGTSDLSFVGGSGSATIVGSASSHENIVGGSGPLVVANGGGQATVQGGTGGTTLFGAAGGQSYYTGSAGAATFVGGAGSETLSAAGSSTNNIFWGGSGAESLAGGSGNDTFTAGSASSTLTGGAGADNFVFQHNALAGNDVTDIVTDFSAAQGDGVILAGYAVGEAANALATATSAGGSTTLTLSDNTKITFLGVGSAGSLNGHIISGT